MIAIMRDALESPGRDEGMSSRFPQKGKPLGTLFVEFDGHNDLLDESVRI